MANRRLPKTLLERLDVMPPFIVYALARKGVGYAFRRIYCKEMAETSELSERTIARISTKLSWRGITVETVDAFFRACRVDPFHLSLQRKYIRYMAKRGKFQHLLPYQQKRFEKLFAEWEKSKTGLTRSEQVDKV